MDRLIKEEKVSHMIIVMPDASTRLGGSQYINSPATGNYADHILELVEFIDGKYRTLADREHRTVMGHSSGGYGALRFGMQHAGVFGLVAAHAPDLYFEMVYRPDFPKFLRFFEKAGEEGLLELLDDPVRALAKGTSFYALAVAAMASCYSPNPESPFGFDLPFHPYTGELHPEVWDRWQVNDPIHMVIDHVEALKSLKLLYLDCGIYDEENLLYGARILVDRLEAYEIPFWYEEFEGGHRNTKYRYDVSLEEISGVFSKEK
jgi:enterochelin esterase family protein